MYVVSNAATKFGSRVFRDFNFSSENINLEEQRRYFGSIADMYNIQLQAGRSNDGVLDELNNRYPNSAFYDPSRFRFLRSHQPNLTEIQEEVLNNINRSTKSILVVQPYYYPISSFERAITSGKRASTQLWKGELTWSSSPALNAISQSISTSKTACCCAGSSKRG